MAINLSQINRVKRSKKVLKMI